MKLRSFTAADMPAVMAQVRAAMGEDAIILSSTADRKTRQITVTAAIEDEDDIPPAPAPRAAAPTSPTRSGAEILATNAQSEVWLDELNFLLRYHGVPDALAGRMVYKARGLDLDKLFALQSVSGGGQKGISLKAVTKLLEHMFRFTPLHLTAGTRLMLVGPPGVGKTLATAKLAAYAAIERLPVQVITTDNKRAGGIEQLSAFTDILQLQLGVTDSAEALEQALHKATGNIVTLIDTAGCNPYDATEIKGLNALIAASGAEPMLTLPSGMDPYEAADTARAFNHSTIKRLLVTRADASRRFGGLLAAADARNLAFSALSMSARVVGEVSPLDPTQLARMLLDAHMHTHAQKLDSHS